jgi:hypothetical protein
VTICQNQSAIIIATRKVGNVVITVMKKIVDKGFVLVNAGGYWGLISQR